MSLTLTMIVKDEQHCIARTLLSALPWVDRWCILDTGSTDDTPGICEWVMRSKPGRVHHGPFIDFADARNRCLMLAGNEGHALMLDAEDVLSNADSLRFLLQVTPGDCFSLVQRWPNETVFAPRLVRLGSRWRYHGRVHELLRHPEGTLPTTLLGPYLEHYPTERGLQKSRRRWLTDVEWMHQDLALQEDKRLREHLVRTEQALAAKV